MGSKAGLHAVARRISAPAENQTPVVQSAAQSTILREFLTLSERNTDTFHKYELAYNSIILTLNLTVLPCRLLMHTKHLGLENHTK
jgi:hypothetical protein